MDIRIPLSLEDWYFGGAQNKFNPEETELATLAQNVQFELVRRHKAAAATVAGLLIASILLSIVAYLGKPYFREQVDPSINIAIRIVVAMLGIGSILWRRTKLSPMRLQDIGALQGALGLLKTLERTTVQVSVFAAAIAACGFVGTLMTGNDFYTYWSAAISVVLLIFTYPRRSSWSNAMLRYGADLGSAPSE